MKVKLAGQSFSSSVSKARTFTMQLGKPGFDGCSGTAPFTALGHQYIFTSHLYQDPLEMYFSYIRQRGG
ncbi:hypothetical protein MRX96_042101 [Rhipicephalus microplus]